ncbi:virion core protein [Pteropox virus]|uniref:Virion core protein n=1 Tax=Pteropox virus TaxID=1873698 RepID=A0A1B1MRB3_9POXV|nr:virion core protein [Pteropox virus]ANS71128.1 virion core protein [Pteropox virus]
MEIINIFLDTESGKIKFSSPAFTCGECTRVNYIKNTINTFLDELDKYIDVDKSDFYIAIKDKDIFYFHCVNGTTSMVNNEFYIFNHGLLVSDSEKKETDDVQSVVFVITDTLPATVFPRKNVSVTFYSCNNKFDVTSL